LGRLPQVRSATYSVFYDVDGSAIDQGIAIYFEAPHSFTGDSVLELQGHGGPAVMQLLLARCLSLGARLATPGEFTQRAFLNGKIDLVQAESVADLIEATSAQAARSAVRSLQGGFSAGIHALVNELIELRAFTEAILDFPEEELDLSDLTWQKSKLDQIQRELDNVLSQAQQGSILREGANIALIGQPNVGKSSLLNALSGDDVALVSDIPGTTRDAIQQSISIKGVPIHLVDTAGIRETDDVVEKMGLDRTRRAANKADLLLLLRDVRSPVDDADQEIFSMLPVSTPRLIVFNKIDLLSQQPKLEKLAAETRIYLSVKTEEGLELLRDTILEMIGWHAESGVYMARQRHLDALNLAMQAIVRAAAQINQHEIFAEELRDALDALSSITGEFSADDLLGEIFGKFCIGK
jgi:tRNA modification GTPase